MYTINYQRAYIGYVTVNPYVRFDLRVSPAVKVQHAFPAAATDDERYYVSVVEQKLDFVKPSSAITLPLFVRFGEHMFQAQRL